MARLRRVSKRFKSYAFQAFVACALAVCLSHRSIHRAEAEGFKEYQIKGLFILNLAKFVTWPEKALADPGGTFRVCILGTDPFGKSLDETFAGKIVQKKPVAISRLSDASNAKGCHVVFIGAAEDAKLTEDLKSFATSPVLTISDIDRFARRGGIVQFVIRNNRVGFEINIDAAEKAGLKLSSQLLSLATIVGTSD